MIFWQWASQYVAVLGWPEQELCQVRFCPLVGLSVGFAKDVPSAEVGVGRRKSCAKAVTRLAVRLA
ncbi:MAG: hypothetical protein RR769_07905 [Anaerovoracaceae bacterium]